MQEKDFQQDSGLLALIISIESMVGLERLLNSIEKNMIWNEGKIKIILLDFYNTDKNTYAQLIEKHNGQDHCSIIDCYGGNLAQIYNEILPKVKSKYISFINTKCWYEEHALDLLGKIIVSVPEQIICMNPQYISEKGDEKYYYNFLRNDEEWRIINLRDTLHAQDFSLHYYSYFFNVDTIKEKRFDERLTYDFEIKFLLEQLGRAEKYLFLKKRCVSEEIPENDYFRFEKQFHKEWYIDSFRYFLCDYITEESPVFLKYAVLYLIQCRFACNLNARDKEVLLPSEVNAFFELVSLALKNIDDIIIRECSFGSKKVLPNWANLNLLRLKYHDETLMPHLIISSNNIVATFKDVIIASLQSEYVEVKTIYFDQNALRIDACFTGSYLFPRDSYQIIVKGLSNIIPVRYTQTYDINKFFNRSAKRNDTFQIVWPVADIPDSSSFAFYLVYQGIKYKLSVRFIRAQAKLTTKFHNSYWVFNQKMLTFSDKDKEFSISKLTRWGIVYREFMLMKEFWQRGDNKKLSFKCISFRLAYWLTKPYFSRKKIWLTQDKIFKAGDNGEYIYRYIEKQKNPDINIYYIIKKNTPDYKRLKSEFKTVVPFNSLFHKLLTLHADLFLATHVDVVNCNGYYHKTQQYFKDLINGKVVCLAHGLTIQKIAQYQNRVFDNTALYFFASKYEIENVSHPVYDYYDAEMLRLTGHARYDGLVDNKKKIILITPTWRRSITTGNASKGSTYAYSVNFKESEYYKIYNALIHDERLCQAARDYGYQIIYLLHPAMSPQLEDFVGNDVMNIIAATDDVSYEKILTEASLMVTDYSGVQFDFAYMKKPLIYYHPIELPPQYEEGGLIYETMGFGPVCTSHEEIIHQLCKHIQENCEMQEIYKKRVDDFFAYNDHHNCERIYNDILEFQRKYRKVNKIF